MTSEEWNGMVWKQFDVLSWATAVAMLNPIILAVAGLTIPAEHYPQEPLVLGLAIRAVVDAVAILYVLGSLPIQRGCQDPFVVVGAIALAGCNILTPLVAHFFPKHFGNSALVTESVWMFVALGLVTFMQKEMVTCLKAELQAGRGPKPETPESEPLTAEPNPPPNAEPNDIERDRTEQLRQVLHSGKDPALIVAQLQHLEEEYARREAEQRRG